MNISIPLKLNFTQQSRIYWLESLTDLLRTFRSPGFVLPSLLFPVMFYLLFGVLFVPSEHLGVSKYLLATYAVFGVMGPALFSFGANVAVEKDRGMLALKQISPMPIAAYFCAKVVTALSFASLIIGLLPFCVIGLYIGLTVKAQAAPAVVNLIYLPISFLSGLWIPVMQFPDVLQKVAMALPPFHFAQLVLKVQGASIGMPWVIHLLVLLAYTLISGLLARRAFKNMQVK